jgi:hypothetical protein
MHAVYISNIRPFNQNWTIFAVERIRREADVKLQEIRIAPNSALSAYIFNLGLTVIFRGTTVHSGQLFDLVAM